jgi:hypothetical protein
MPNWNMLMPISDGCDALRRKGRSTLLSEATRTRYRSGHERRIQIVLTDNVILEAPVGVRLALHVSEQS